MCWQLFETSRPFAIGHAAIVFRKRCNQAAMVARVLIAQIGLGILNALLLAPV